MGMDSSQRPGQGGVFCGGVALHPVTRTGAGVSTYIAKPEAKRRVVGGRERGGCVATRWTCFDHHHFISAVLRGDGWMVARGVEIT